MKKVYNQPATEIMDLSSEKLMVGGMSMASGAGSGHADAPQQRGDFIP